MRSGRRSGRSPAGPLVARGSRELSLHLLDRSSPHRALTGTALSLLLALAAACSSTPAPAPDADPRAERPAGAVDSQPEPDAARIERPEPEAGLDASSVCNDIVQGGTPVAVMELRFMASFIPTRVAHASAAA